MNLSFLYCQKVRKFPPKRKSTPQKWVYVKESWETTESAPNGQIWNSLSNKIIKIMGKLILWVNLASN